MRSALIIAAALLRVFARNRVALFFTFLFPILLFAVVATISGNRQPQIDVGLIQGGSTSLGDRLVRNLEKTPGVALHIGTVEGELTALAAHKRALVLDLRKVKEETALDRPAAVPVIESGARKGEAVAGLVLIRQSLADPNIRTSPFDFAVRSDGSRYVPFEVFLLPGIIGFAAMQMCIFSVAQGQVQARQSGMLKGMLLTRMTGFEFVMGTAISRMLLAVCQAAALIAVAVLAFKVQPEGSLVSIAAVVLLGGIAFVGIGFLISGLTTSQETVNPIANAVMLPMFLLGGVFFPVTSLPLWLQGVAGVLPLANFTAALRQAITTASVDAIYARNMLTLSVWAVIIVLTASILVRRRAAETD